MSDKVATEASATNRALKRSRQRRILDLLEQRRQLRVTDLAAELGVAEETVRRDFQVLERQGRLQRVHGGALRASEKLPEPMAARLNRSPAEKEKIAALALPLFQEADNVFLGSGSTVFFVAKRLGEVPPTRIVTNMFDLAPVAAQDGRHEVVLTGGNYNPLLGNLTGAGVLRSVQEQFFNMSIVGVSAIHHQHGILIRQEFSTSLYPLLADRSARLVVLAMSSEFGLWARYIALPLSKIDTVLTDRKPAAPYLDALTDAGATVMWPD